jgi:hypothetical protein
MQIPVFAADVTVFSNNLDGAIPSEFSGITTTQAVQGFAGLGPSGNQFAGNFLRNSTGGVPTGTPSSFTTLTLTGLPTHDSVNLGFLFAALESWDGSGSAALFGDFFNVVLGDGVTSHSIFSETFSRPGAGPQSYAPPPGVLLSTGTDLGNFGITSTDSAYNMGADPTFQNIPHTASTLVVSWFANGPGWQGGSDESWAIDNVTVSVSSVSEPVSVPEPISALLLPSGLLLLAAAKKFRRAAPLP